MEAASSLPPYQHFPCAPDVMPLAVLEDAIATLSATIAAATWRMLVLLAEFDRREGWAGSGIQSCAHWLNWRCGIDVCAAREKLRVARALPQLPLINAAFAAGEISYSKVRAMTRVATAENEADLLLYARHGTAAHVEKIVRAYRGVQRIAEREAANQAEASRAVHWYYDDDGMLVLKARLQAIAGAMLLKGLTAAMDDLAADDEKVSAETSGQADEPFAARRADALAHLAEQFLASGSSASRQAERHQIVIHVEPASLHEHAGQDGGQRRCELEHGPALAMDTARRLACDASLVVIAEDADGNPLNVGRRTRSIPPAIRRALHARDAGCRYPGCLHHRYVDAHHIQHWADGGETGLDNLVLLCRFHHRLLHEGGFTLNQARDGSYVFRDAHGSVVPQTPTPLVLTQPLAAMMAAGGVNISAETGRSQWRGERLDLRMAMDALIQSDARGLTSIAIQQ